MRITMTCAVVALALGSGPAFAQSGEITIWSWNIAASSLKATVAGFNKQFPDAKVNAGDGDCDITIKADVAEHLGSVSYVNAGKDELIIEREAMPSRHRANGDHLTVSIKADRSLLFDSTGARIR